ncbi:hypothetical protein [Granulicella tundricola]|uniref:Porin n=1 Tax=Granulicella tundricola (strain ATCC BAA-1859 / DSM 23138 / MP5ACTX9) TaxID=1198114 RepID=E8WW68_GRATM|nr:hypothetical protein [Granulicella tundricola]ADW68451.1 hypothetical protein AciX9_1392 [Granulicella tundricola MP5ACTX9]
MKLQHLLASASALLCLSVSQAQQSPMPNMPGMEMHPPAQAPKQQKPMQDMPGMDMTDSSMSMNSMMKPATTLIDSILQHSSSGTTIETPSEPMRMWMSATPRRGWSLMLHGDAFLADIQQHATGTPTPPPAAVCTEIAAACITPDHRGTDKLFSTNWVMPMGMHSLNLGSHQGQFTLRSMLSIEPATVQQGFYPELFQQGETANGKAIVDGQHPHDFVMELAALYDLHLSKHSLLSLYAAPVGDPAIGPTAYPHRLSASEDPIAALGHHQEDSTHIAFNVFTAGLTYKTLRIEGSGFHGAEPTEARWHFAPSPNGHAVDSYSTRITWVPTANLSAQYSIAHITSPEALHPGEDQGRQTASVMYNRPRKDSNWSNTFIWGRTKSLKDGSIENSYLAESLLNFRTNNFAWTRVEFADRTSELLLDQYPTNPNPPEITLGHVQAYSLGYDRQYRIAPHLLAAPGAQFTLYRAPDPLVSTYGRTPFSAVAFIRFRISQ